MYEGYGYIDMSLHFIILEIILPLHLHLFCVGFCWFLSAHGRANALCTLYVKGTTRRAQCVHMAASAGT